MPGDHQAMRRVPIVDSRCLLDKTCAGAYRIFGWTHVLQIVSWVCLLLKLS